MLFINKRRQQVSSNENCFLQKMNILNKEYKPNGEFEKTRR
jgi:hypothetical protein